MKVLPDIGSSSKVQCSGQGRERITIKDQVTIIIKISFKSSSHYPQAVMARNFKTQTFLRYTGPTSHGEAISVTNVILKIAKPPVGVVAQNYGGPKLPSAATIKLQL